MTTFIPIYDNGQEYEDHQSQLGGIVYIKEESAIDSIKSKGFIVEETYPYHLDTDIQEYEGVRFYKEPIENVTLKSVTGKLLDDREYMYIHKMPLEENML